MRVSPAAAQASPRRNSWSLTCSLLAALAFPNVAQGDEPLRFDWPVPCKVGVTSSIQRDSISICLHYVLHLARTPHSNELEYNFEEPEVLDVTVAGRYDPRIDAMVSHSTALLAGGPPVIISRDGKFLRSTSRKEEMAELMGWTPGTPLPELDPTTWAAAEAENEAGNRGMWDSWVGSWAGLSLGEGEHAEATVPLPVIDGPLIEGTATIENLGSALINTRWVRLRLTSTNEGDTFRTTLEQHLQALNRRAGSREIPVASALKTARREYSSAVVLEPQTLRLNYAASGASLELEYANGDRQTRGRAEEDFFEWDPPLPADDTVESVPADALQDYDSGRLEEAYRGFKREITQGTRNPTTYAYYADLNRRLGYTGEAVLAARRTLRLSPRNSFAHCVLAETYNPRTTQWPRRNADSTVIHYQQALACDSTDGNAWMGLLIEAKRLAQPGLERMALSKLVTTAFLTPPLRAYARWMLRCLPHDSILLTFGDMDTYPLWAVQEIEGIRPDVSIVNINLLNLTWYAREVRDHHRVPLSYQDAALDALAPEWRDSEQRVVQVAEKLVQGWLDLQQSGSLARPIAVATTVPLSALPPGSAPRLRFIGPAWIFAAAPVKSEMDLDASRTNLEAASAADLAGAMVSASDRSPVRRSAPPLSDNVVAAWVRYTQALIAGGYKSGARKSLDRAEQFAARVGASPTLQTQLSDLRRMAEEK